LADLFFHIFEGVRGMYIYSVLDLVLLFLRWIVSPNLAKWLSILAMAFCSSRQFWNRKKLSSTKKEVWKSECAPLDDGFWLRSLLVHVLRLTSLFLGK
jgi:hypothetical protein